VSRIEIGVAEPIKPSLIIKANKMHCFSALFW